MKPAPFRYHAPDSVEEALGLLAAGADGAKVLAGGQSLVPMLALRLAVFDDLVDIGRVEALRGIQVDTDAVHIGAMTTQSAIEHHPDLAASVPLLARATPLIGHFQIRNRGTLGGSLAHADPAAEYPAVALTLDATLETLSPRGPRSIPAAEFFTGVWDTTLAEDELLTGVAFPRWSGRCGFAIEEFARRHGDFAIAGAAVALALGPDDTVTRCAIGLLGLGPTPLRASAAEAETVGTGAADLDPAEVGRLAMRDLGAVPADLHGSADYRTHIGAVMVRRALTCAIEEARDG